MREVETRKRWWNHVLTRHLVAVETLGPRVIVMAWSDGKRSQFETTLPDERDELCRELDRLIQAAR